MLCSGAYGWKFPRQSERRTSRVFSGSLVASRVTKLVASDLRSRHLQLKSFTATDLLLVDSSAANSGSAFIAGAVMTVVESHTQGSSRGPYNDVRQSAELQSQEQSYIGQNTTSRHNNTESAVTANGAHSAMNSRSPNRNETLQGTAFANGHSVGSNLPEAAAAAQQTYMNGSPSRSSSPLRSRAARPSPPSQNRPGSAPNVNGRRHGHRATSSLSSRRGNLQTNGVVRAQDDSETDTGREGARRPSALLMRAKSDFGPRGEFADRGTDDEDGDIEVYGARHGFEDHYISEEYVSQLANVSSVFSLC